MKMRYIFTMAMGTLLAIACNKADIEQPDNAPVAKNESVYEIKAEIVDTKTTYDVDGKFSWLSADRITVVVYNDGSTEPAKLNKLDHYTFSNSTGDGTTATFTGSAINSPWHELGVALYPNTNMSSANCLAEAGAYDTGLQVTVKQEIAPELSNPMSVIPLIGRKNAQDVYQFKTATGILKVTVANIPTDAYYLYLIDPSGTFHFSGTFNVGDKDVIRSEDYASGDASNKKTIAFTPLAAGETRTFYFPVPIGTIPVGTQLKLDKGYSGGYANIMKKTFNSDVAINANHVTPLASVYVCPEDVSELFGRYRISGNGTHGAEEAYITLASTDEGGYNIRISRYENVNDSADITGTCLGVYNREEGTITFASMQLFADTGTKWTDDSSIYYSFRSYDSPSQNLTLYVNSATTLSTKGKRFDFSKFVSSYSTTSGYLQLKQYGNSTLTKVL